MRTQSSIATTIAIKETTKRLLEYKTEKMTYDDVLNYMMDIISMDDIAEKDIKEHFRRLETFDPVPKTNSRR